MSMILGNVEISFLSNTCLPVLMCGVTIDIRIENRCICSLVQFIN
jgi:hypothetical protein